MSAQLLLCAGGGASCSSAAAAAAVARTLRSNVSLACACGAAASSAAWCTPRAQADALQSSSSAAEEEPQSSSQDPSELKSIISVFHPLNLLGIAARNIGFSCLLGINVYILELLDHEQGALDAEARGEEPSKPPPLPDLRGQAAVGVRSAVREVAVRVVRRVYEHLTVWRLGAARAAPFLRDGVLWIHHVLHPKYLQAPQGHRLFSFGFALLHANALLYAADCTVAVMQHTVRVSKERGQSRRQKALTVLAGTGFHVGRCLFVLCATSFAASLASLAKPGLGTRVGWFLSDTFLSQQMFICQKSLGL